MSDIDLNLRKLQYGAGVTAVNDNENGNGHAQSEIEETDEQTVEAGSVGINDREGSLFALEQAAMLATVAQNVTPALAATQANTTEYTISGIKVLVTKNSDNAGFRYKIENDNKIIFTVSNCTISIAEGNANIDIDVKGSDVTLNSNAKVKSITNYAINATINGSDEDDVIINKTGKATLNGNAGNDIITNYGISSTIRGGDGNDTITSKTAYTTVFADAGKDNIFVSGYQSTINSGADNDSIYAEGRKHNITANTGNNNISLKGHNSTITSGSDAKNDIQVTGTNNEIKDKSLYDKITVNGEVTQEGNLGTDRPSDTNEDGKKLDAAGNLLTGIYAPDGKMYKDGVLLTGVSSIDNRLYKDGEINPERTVVDNKLYENGTLTKGLQQEEDKYYYNGSIANGEIEGKLYQNGVIANGEINGFMYVQGQKADKTEVNGFMYVDGKKANCTIDGVKYVDGVAQTGGVTPDEPDTPVNPDENEDGKKLDAAGNLLTGIYAPDGKMYKDGVLLTGVSSIDNRLYKDGEINPERTVIDNKLYENGTLTKGLQQEEDKYYYNGSIANGEIEGKLYQNGVIANGEINGFMYVQGQKADKTEVNGFMYVQGQKADKTEVNGFMYVQGQKADKTEVNGFMYVDGQKADKTEVNGFMYVQGQKADKTEVNGYMYVNGQKADKVKVNGFMYVEGKKANCTIDGVQYVEGVAQTGGTTPSDPIDPVEPVDPPLNIDGLKNDIKTLASFIEGLAQYSYNTTPRKEDSLVARTYDKTEKMNDAIVTFLNKALAQQSFSVNNEDFSNETSAINTTHVIKDESNITSIILNGQKLYLNYDDKGNIDNINFVENPASTKVQQVALSYNDKKEIEKLDYKFQGTEDYGSYKTTITNTVDNKKKIQQSDIVEELVLTDGDMTQRDTVKLTVDGDFTATAYEYFASQDFTPVAFTAKLDTETGIITATVKSDEGNSYVSKAIVNKDASSWGYSLDGEGIPAHSGLLVEWAILDAHGTAQSKYEFAYSDNELKAIHVDNLKQNGLTEEEMQLLIMANLGTYPQKAGFEYTILPEHEIQFNSLKEQGNYSIIYEKLTRPYNQQIANQYEYNYTGPVDPEDPDTPINPDEPDVPEPVIPNTTPENVATGVTLHKDSNGNILGATIGTGDKAQLINETGYTYAYASDKLIGTKTNAQTGETEVKEYQYIEGKIHLTHTLADGTVKNYIDGVEQTPPVIPNTTPEQVKEGIILHKDPNGRILGATIGTGSIARVINEEGYVYSYTYVNETFTGTKIDSSTGNMETKEYTYVDGKAYLTHTFPNGRVDNYINWVLQTSPVNPSDPSQPVDPVDPVDPSQIVTPIMGEMEAIILAVNNYSRVSYNKEPEKQESLVALGLTKTQQINEDIITFVNKALNQTSFSISGELFPTEKTEIGVTYIEKYSGENSSKIKSIELNGQKLNLNYSDDGSLNYLSYQDALLSTNLNEICINYKADSPKTIESIRYNVQDNDASDLGYPNLSYKGNVVYTVDNNLKVTESKIEYEAEETIDGGSYDFGSKLTLDANMTAIAYETAIHAEGLGSEFNIISELNTFTGIITSYLNGGNSDGGVSGYYKAIVNKDASSWIENIDYIPGKSGRLVEKYVDAPDGGWLLYEYAYANDECVAVHVDGPGSPTPEDWEALLFYNYCTYPQKSGFDATALPGQGLWFICIDDGDTTYHDVLAPLTNPYNQAIVEQYEYVKPEPITPEDKTEGEAESGNGTSTESNYTYTDANGNVVTGQFIPAKDGEPAKRIETGVKKSGDPYTLTMTQNEDGTWRGEEIITDKDKNYRKQNITIRYDENETIQGIIYNVYDENGNTLFSGDLEYNVQGKLSSETQSVYDPNTRLKIEESIYKYNSDENLTEQTTNKVDGNGNTYKNIVSKWDNDGKLISTTENDYTQIHTLLDTHYEQSLSYENIPNFDENGNITSYNQTVTVASTGEILSVNNVDPNGNYISSISANDADGYISYFNQGKIGDCSILSTLKALGNENFNLVDNGVIKWNDDGSATVRLYDIDHSILDGIGGYNDPTIKEPQYYTISKADIEKGYVQIGDRQYKTVKGDSDVKAIELALLKYKAEKDGTNLDFSDSSTNGGSSDFHMTVKDSIAMIVGNDYDNYNPTYELQITNEELAKGKVAYFDDGMDYSADITRTIETNGETQYYVKDIITGKQIKLPYPHAYTIESYNSTLGTVTLTNPHNYSSFTISAETAKSCFAITTFNK